MAKRDLTKPMGKVTFHCDCAAIRTKADQAGAGWTFDAVPARVEDAPDQPHHPYRYFARCAVCGEEAEQAPWERALIKGWANATGPKTEEGKAASASNLEGHPTPAETKLTRFNAMRTGLHAQVAQYFPARPDGYSFCNGCKVDREWCGQQAACSMRTELFLQHQAAFDQGDPKRLNGVYSNLHAALLAIVQQLIQTIISDGVDLTTPKFGLSDGRVVFVKWKNADTGVEHQIYEKEAHPLFKPLNEMITRLGISLSDMGMTVREVSREDEDEMGYLQPGAATAGSLEDFSKKQAESLAALRAQLDRSKVRREQDPVLLEHRAVNGGEET